MTTITQTRVFLQYGKAGDPTSDFCTVHPTEEGMFVAIDSASGGYPCPTDIDSAHDFNTVEKANNYARHFLGFIVREVTVTYEFDGEDLRSSDNSATISTSPYRRR